MPNTDDQTGWLQLLSSLTDDELHRYGEIAADQRRQEWQHGWAQMGCAIAGLVAMGLFVRECAFNGPTWRGATILGLAIAFAYWPYRKAVVRHLWGKHCKAVAREEAARRGTSARVDTE
jgi:hypothetical protein